MFINDPVHGFIELNQLQEALLDLPEMQRLSWIKQLGLSCLSYPGGVHTRLGHGIGVSCVAGEMAKALKLNEKETFLLQAAGLLHDVGHTPFSHALESLLPIDHMEYTTALIRGDETMPVRGGGLIPVILKEYGLDPAEVGSLVNCSHSNPVLQTVIHGSIDADQLDYLLRDAYFCGIAHGNIDLYRLLHTLRIDESGREVLLLEKGIDAIEEMIVARDHMYSAVYAHKTSRIGEMMLLRAVELSRIKYDDLYSMTDSDLISALKGSSAPARELVERILFRNLYKIAYFITSRAAKHERSALEFTFGEKNPGILEGELSAELGLQPGELIVDFPSSVLAKTEPRLQKIETRILLKNGTVTSLRRVSALARALLTKESTHNVFAVYTASEHTGEVHEVVRKKLTPPEQISLFHP
jgi:hypothetical protein